MIDKEEILERARILSLEPSVVEKDYVLGWLLHAIGHHPELSEQWVFKGGTCLKKIHFETYRFSEDLDFTLRDASHLDPSFLGRVFQEIAEALYEEVGLELPIERLRFDERTNPRGHPAVEGRIYYRGPLGLPASAMPRIKLDLTADERLVEPPGPETIVCKYSADTRRCDRALATDTRWIELEQEARGPAVVRQGHSIEERSTLGCHEGHHRAELFELADAADRYF